MAVDPVCGMTVDPATAAGQYDYQGVTYYFCATSCLETFKRNPQLALQAREPEFITLGRKKPLTMMPASTSVESGNIDPVCGMTVQPESAAGSHVHKGTTTAERGRRKTSAKALALPRSVISSSAPPSR